MESRMRLTGPRIYMAIEPRPVAPALSWHREPLRVRAMGWLSWLRWREPSERTLTVAAIVAVVAILGAAAWWSKYGN